MINFFKAHNPFNILWLAILLFALRAGYLFNIPPKIQFAFAEPFTRLLLPFGTQYQLSPGFNVFLAGAFVFVQALLLNQLVNQFNLLGKPTFLPALMYITVSGLFTPFLVLSQPLLCNFLIIWMLFKLIGFYKSTDAKSSSYDLGMIVAVGSIVYLPFVYFFLVIWVGLILYKPFNWREAIAGIIGYATVFFFLAVYYYWNNSLGEFYNIWLPLGAKFPDSIKINYLDYLVLIPVIIILILCFFTLQQNFFKSYVQVRKTFQLLFYIFLIAGCSFYIRAAFHLNHFLLCAVPAAVFFSYYFLYAKRKWFYETLYIILLVSIVYFQFNTF
jgi:hypothetical protein